MMICWRPAAELHVRCVCERERQRERKYTSECAQVSAVAVTVTAVTYRPAVSRRPLRSVKSNEARFGPAGLRGSVSAPT